MGATAPPKVGTLGSGSSAVRTCELSISSRPAIVRACLENISNFVNLDNQFPMTTTEK